MNIHDATETAYKNGYADGKADAMAELVRCKDCKHWESHCNGKAGICPKRKGVARADDFCSYGERKDNE